LAVWGEDSLGVTRLELDGEGGGGAGGGGSGEVQAGEVAPGEADRRWCVGGQAQAVTPRGVDLQPARSTELLVRLLVVKLRLLLTGRLLMSWRSESRRR